jgi:predicted RNA-binding protein YlqC (UPF0109 family)
MPVESLLWDIIASCCDQPIECRIVVGRGEQTLLLEVFTRAPDVAYLIGKEGQMVEAMRWVLGIVGVREGLRVYLEVYEEGAWI